MAAGIALAACPGCRNAKARPLLQEQVEGGWAVTCHGCHLQVFALPIERDEPPLVVRQRAIDRWNDASKRPGRAEVSSARTERGVAGHGLQGASAVGAKIIVRFGPGHPSNRELQVRGVVDGDRVVAREWSRHECRWVYEVLSPEWFAAFADLIEIRRAG